MAKDSSPICFRVSDLDREVLEAAASFVGESLSAFVRHAALATAQEVMQDGGGVNAVLQLRQETRQRRDDFVRTKNGPNLDSDR